MPTQLSAIPLFGGIDTKTDPKMVDRAHLVSASNAVYSQASQVSKRYGQKSLPTTILGGGNITSATSLGQLNGELLLFNGSSLYSYGQQQQAWINKGDLTEISTTSAPVIQNANSRSDVTSCTAGGTSVFVWADSSGGLRYSVQDQTTGAFYLADVLLDGAGSAPQLCTAGNYVNVFYVGGGQVRARQLLLGNPGAGFGGFLTLAADLQPNTYVACAGLGASVVFAYWGVAGAGNTVQLRRTNTSLSITQIASVPTSGGGASLSISVNAAGTQGTLASLGSISLYVTTFDSALNLATGSLVTTGTPSTCSVVYTGASTVAVAYSSIGGFLSGKHSRVQIAKFNVSGTPTLVGTPVSTWGVVLASQGFFQGLRAYFVCASSQFQVLTASALSAQTSYYLVNDSGTILLRFGGATAMPPSAVLTQPFSLNSTSWVAGLLNRTQLRSTAAGTLYATTGVQGYTFNFPAQSRAKVVPFAGSASILCGNVYHYDGKGLVEAGFWQAPEGLSVAPGGPGNLSAGLYSYIATYEWTDINGAVHRSAPSFVATYQAAAGTACTVKVPTLPMTRRQGAVGDVQITLYRPLVNQSGPYYQVAQQSNSAAFAGTLSVTFTDGQADSAISGQPYLYAPPDGSGEVENDAPPPFLDMVATKTRLFGIASEDQTAIWYTKPLNPGRPAEWSVFQTIRLESAGGAATALGALDKQLVIFKQSRMYLLPGDGPNSAGQPANGFGIPELISSVTGCSNPGSVVFTEQGLFYQSPRGIELLNRNFNTDHTVGLPVWAYRAVPLVAAVAVPDQTQIRFYSGADTCLVYEYQLNRWTTFSNQACVGAALWQGAATRLEAGGTAWQETPGAFLDGGVGYPLAIETSWLRPQAASVASPVAGSQGYTRVRRLAILGGYVSPHLLYIDIAYDYQDYSYTLVWNPVTGLVTSYYGDGTPYGSGVDKFFGGPSGQAAPIYQVRARLPRQKCEAVRFRIRDGSITGASCTLNELALEQDMKPGINRLPSGQTV